MPSYEMKSQLNKSQERQIDKYFRQYYFIRPVNRFGQRSGIDRTWVCRQTKCEYWVEYKADRKMADTNNVFIETVSVDSEETNILGWAYTSKAQMLVYFSPQWNKAFLVSMDRIKTRLTQWSKKYRTATTSTNKNGHIQYYTHGLLVPLDDFIEDCEVITWTLNGQ